MKLRLNHTVSALLIVALIYSTGCSKTTDNMSGTLVGGAWNLQTLRTLQKDGNTVIKDSTYTFTNVALTFDSTGHFAYAGGNFVSGTYVQNGTSLIMSSGSTSNTSQINILTAHTLQLQYTTNMPPSYTVNYTYSYTR